MRRTTKITLAIMGAGLATLGAVAAVEKHHGNSRCETAKASGELDTSVACSHASGGRGGGGTAENKNEDSAVTADASERGGFGETGSHAGGEGGE